MLMVVLRVKKRNEAEVSKLLNPESKYDDPRNASRLLLTHANFGSRVGRIATCK